ncbi:hypothetical protein [Antribacter gilvus]|uniref:hypothetical protein n=1 Tax=Antribacter gilvus TaxID=2304675 RepID=UPI000F79A173|nr:hypothetical protein [Antribacter gilvus]
MTIGSAGSSVVRVRGYWDEEDEWHWLELDGEGYAVRHAVFRNGAPVTAAVRADLEKAFQRAGVLGFRFTRRPTVCSQKASAPRISTTRQSSP